MGESGIAVADEVQYPAKEVQDLHNQLLDIEKQLDEKVSHEGKSAEEAYAERLAQISLQDSSVQDGNQVVSTLLGRCLIWVEVIEKK